MKKVISLIMSAVMLFLLVGCGTPADDTSAKVYLSNSSLRLAVGDTYTLQATVSGARDGDNTVVFSTQHTDIIDCTSDGRITAKKSGSAAVYAHLTETEYAKCYVDVSDGATFTLLKKVGDVIKRDELISYATFKGQNIVWEYDESILQNDGDTFTVIAMGDSDIIARCGSDFITAATVHATVDKVDLVHFETPELPKTFTYQKDGAEYTSVVDGFECEKILADDGYNVIIHFKVIFTDTSYGASDENTVGFDIELYSEEVGFCTRYNTVKSDMKYNDKTGKLEVVYSFYTDVSERERHFNIVIVGKE